MSTRSGKRIHSIANENIENIVESKSDRNTRSKRQKVENDLPVTEKKRKYYVRYPSEEDVANIENIAKSAPKSRRHTLKEQNILATDSETSNDERRAVRSTRRTKVIEEPEVLENTETKVEKVVTEKKKKGKKKNAKVTEENNENNPELKISKKKSSKKKNKKKSNSITVEEIHDNVDGKDLNNSKASNESFHSAAGSPTYIPSVEQPINDILDNNKLRKNKKHDNLESNILTDKANRKRKITEMECDDIKDDSNQELLSNPGDKSISNETNVSNEKTQEKKFNKSLETSFKEKKHANKKLKKDKTNATFEMNNSKELSTSKLNNVDNKHSSPKIVTNINTTFDKESRQSDQGIINITLSASKNKRKSSIKNSTYDKVDNQSIMNLDVTFEKASQSNEEKSLSSNTTAELKDSNSSKHSLIQNNTITLNSTYDKNSKTISVLETSNSLNTTFDKPTKLDTTFDKNLKKDSIDQSQMNPQAKSSLISSDTTESSTINITDDISRVSLTSDDSKAENILNTTPVLIESSMDDSRVDNNELTTDTKKTPLKRQGIFTEVTKDSPSNRDKETKPVTPLKRDTRFTEVTKDSPSNRDKETKPVTPLKRDTRFTEVTKDSPSNRDKETKPVTPLKRDTRFTEVTKDSPSNRDKETKPVTPLKRDTRFTEVTKDSPSNRDKETKPVTPLKRDTTFTESDVTPKKNTPDSKHNPRRSSIKTPQSTKKTFTTKPETPLKREGTFTKDSPDVTMSPKVKNQLTPRRKSLPSPGCTPFPHSKSSSKEKNTLNITWSLEKSRRSSVADVPPRMTKVMFCSPVNNPVVVSQMKGKVIKSNLKGSNKSFVFDDDSECRSSRKRSYTHSETDSDRTAQLRSARRLSRSRTASAAARLQDTPAAKKPTKEARRTKLPNFAALHKKQFARMESLDECVMRKAKRARLLLTPSTASKTLRTSPKETSKEAPADPPKKEAPKMKQPEPNPGFTRFGFKLNLDVNPFSIPPKSEVIEKQPILKRQVTLPSLAGTTNLRREIAKQAVMREKSFTEKRHTNRDENRTVIKGVRTNRRFELQMKMRNINNQ